MRTGLKLKTSEVPGSRQLLDQLRVKYGQLWLDVGAGDDPQPKCVAMDRRNIPGIDVVHDIEDFPWPFPDDTFDKIIASHIIEHIDPSKSIDVMNEAWRVMAVGGEILIAMPYPGSFGHWQDPTHIRPWNEATPSYFDPEDPRGNLLDNKYKNLYEIYRPKPWKITYRAWKNDGNLEIVMMKRAENDKK